MSNDHSNYYEQEKNDVITTTVTKYYNSLWYKKLSWSSFDSKNLFQVIYDLLRKTKAAPPIIVIWWFCNYYKNENQNKTWSIGNDAYVSSNLTRLDIAVCQLFMTLWLTPTEKNCHGMHIIEFCEKAAHIFVQIRASRPRKQS